MKALFTRLQVKKEHVDSLIESLALQSCRNTQIGGILSRGISGGEVRSRPLNVMRGCMTLPIPLPLQSAYIKMVWAPCWVVSGVEDRLSSFMPAVCA